MGIALAVLMLLVFAAYHGWRLLKAVPTALRTGDSLQPAPFPPVSFLVPAWNDGDHIRPFVASYRALSYPRKELILCVGGSDGSWREANGLAAPDIQVIEQCAGEGKQTALRHSYTLASGDIIYLTDIDCRLNDQTVNNLLNAIVRDGRSAVTGSSRPLPTQSRNAFVQAQWAVEQQVAPKSVCQTSGILGRNAAIARPALNGAGAFEENVPAGTDYFLAKKLIEAGTDIYYMPGQPMPSEYPETLPVYIHKQARWIRNVFVLGHQFHNIAEMRASLTTMLLPIAMLLLLVASVVTALTAQSAFWPVATLTVLVALHSCLNRIYYLRQAGIMRSGGTVFLHWYADMAASLTAAWQILTRRFVW